MTFNEIDYAARQRAERKLVTRYSRMLEQAEYMWDLLQRMDDVLPEGVLGGTLHAEVSDLRREFSR